jgi:hypothetical protein
MTQDNDTETLPQRSSQPRPDITAGAPVLPLVPKSFDEVLRYARMVLMAGAVPDSLTKESGRQLPENEIVARVVAVIAAGSEVHMPPMSAMANIALVNKKRVIWGQGAVAVLQNSGQLEDMKVERIGSEPGASITTAQFADDFGIRVVLKRKELPTPFVGEFTVGMAKRSHLWMNASKRPWVEFPEKMLFWRAFNNAVGAGFGDCMAGLGIREVLDDQPPPRQITDTSFLDAPAREEVVPNTPELRTDNAQAPVEEPGPTPEEFPPFPGDLPSAQPVESPTHAAPQRPPPARRARQPRQPPSAELRLKPDPEPDEREEENDRQPPDPDLE